MKSYFREDLRNENFGKEKDVSKGLSFPAHYAFENISTTILQIHLTKRFTIFETQNGKLYDEMVGRAI